MTTVITLFFNYNKKSMYYSKASNTLLYNPATQRAQGETSGAAASMQQAQKHWVRDRLRVRHQGPLEEENFDMVLQERGKCSVVLGPWGIAQKV